MVNARLRCFLICLQRVSIKSSRARPLPARMANARFTRGDALVDRVLTGKAASLARRRLRQRWQSRTATAPAVEACFERAQDAVETDEFAPAPEAALPQANDNFTAANLADDEPPFDPPDDDDILGMGDVPEDEPPFDLTGPDVFVAPTAEADEPPFDPPDAEDDVFVERHIEAMALAASVNRIPPPATEAPSNPAAEGQPPSLVRATRDRDDEQPVPPITVHVSWSRPEIATLLSDLSADRRLARADVTLENGGLEGAIDLCAGGQSPDLLIIDTTLPAADILDGLSRLALVIDRATKVIVLGAVNDVSLLRELAARGVSEYIVSPTQTEDLVRVVCRLFAGVDRSRVIAVVGARGGVGASTIAHNIAWSIAERFDAATALLDLDLPFGASTFSFNQHPPHSVADLLIAPESFDDAFLDRAIVKHTARLQLLTAPATLTNPFEPDPEVLQAAVARVRRTSSFVLLDLPHAWEPWVKHALMSADEVIIVASPDLASLRNAKSMFEVLKSGRSHKSEPSVVLSMVGAPKRPEIMVKDFAETLGATPVASFAFDPGLFGTAANKAQMIAELDPRSKAALMFDALAEALTGRKPVKKKKDARPAPRAAAGARVLNAEPTAKTEIANAPAPYTFVAPAPVTGFSRAAAQLELPFDGLPASDAALPPLDLVRPVDRAPKADVPLPKPARRRSSGLIRMAAAIITLVSVGAWFAQNHRDDATAAEPRVTQAPLAAQPPSPPPPPPAADARAGQYASAVTLLNSDAAAGMSALRVMADSDFAPAQYKLAKLYENGQGVPADLTIARQWTERAAANGNVHAMHDLGVYFARGEGAPRDEATAFRWFRQAAEFGVRDSQFNLGILYQQGRGVSADPTEAMFWFLVAARLGDANAAARATALEPQVTLMQVEQARARANAFRPRLPDAEANLELTPPPAAPAPTATAPAPDTPVDAPPEASAT